MSLTPKELDDLRRHIDELESRIDELESNTQVIQCQEFHIVNSEGIPVISLSVNEENSGEILVRNASGKSGVQILGKDQYGGGFLEVFKDFSETLEPFCVPRRDAVRIRINQEILGGGGKISTHRNHAPNVTLGSGYGYAGELWIQGEHDRKIQGAARIVLGVNRERDEGVILIQKPVYNEEENDYEMETVAKIGHAHPPKARYRNSSNEIES